jgi:hypothetical protein
MNFAPPARKRSRSGPCGVGVPWQPRHPVLITMYRPRSAIARSPGSLMSSVRGGAVDIGAENVSGEEMKNGGMK